jgi:hypothetical protein
MPLRPRGLGQLKSSQLATVFRVRLEHGTWRWHAECVSRMSSDAEEESVSKMTFDHTAVTRDVICRRRTRLVSGEKGRQFGAPYKCKWGELGEA